MTEPKNVALHKKVNAKGANAGAITDGERDRALHWDGGVAPAKATIDLKGYFSISSIRLTTYYGDGRAYRFKIRAGGTPTQMLELVDQNEDVLATEEGYYFTFDPMFVRYVEVEMLHNTANPSVHITELEVFGVPAEEYLIVSEKQRSTVNPDPADIAYGKPVRASINNEYAFVLTDGTDETCFFGELYPRHLDVDLEKNYDLDKVTVVGPNFADYNYVVYTSLDGVNFRRYGKCKTTMEERTVTIMRNVEARVIRLLVEGTSQGAHGVSAVCQLKAYGKPLDTEIVPTRKSLSFTDYDSWMKEKCGVDLSAIKDSQGKYDPKDSYTAEDTVKALEGLITRILGEKYISWFSFEIDREHKGDNYFELNYVDGKIAVKADCGVSAAMGLNWYLKYYCKVQVAQQTKQVKMPEKVVPLNTSIRQSTPYEVRYAYNYCTLSYTMPFFSYEKWQRELDYLMLSGVNLILDLTGTEALWVSYLQKLGFTVDEAKDYVCGYCYKAWWLMGNLEGYCGPVADSWVIDTLEMARVNQRYMTVMGAQPALQTFVGAMPEAFGSIADAHLKAAGFENVAEYMAPQGLWAGGFVRPNVLKTTFPGYSYLAKMFYDTQDELYGQVTDYYCGDVCHEGGIIPADLSKPEMSAKILNELLSADEKAVWILQGWWSNPIKAVLDGFGDKKVDHIMILDLASLAKPKWTDTTTWDGAEFGGTPWVYCNLENYGGRPGMHGKLQKMTELMDEVRIKAKFLKGIGITPEGTNVNPVVFDLFWEMAWRDSVPDINFWLAEYITRRYGKLTDNALFAWKLFAKTVYGVDSYDGTSKNNVINDDACLSMTFCSGPYFKIGYSRTVFEEGVLMLMEDYDKLCGAEGYIYDVVDLLRMVLTIATDDYFEVLRRAYAARHAQHFGRYSDRFIKAMELIGELCLYNKDEMLGNWIGNAYDWAKDERTGYYAPFDMDIMEYNARILISDWGSSPITNYGNRQYSGLMEDYYIRMWSELLDQVNYAFRKNLPAPERLGSRCFEIGWEFATNGKYYRRTPAKPQGDGEDRGLVAIWRDVQRHLTDTSVKQAIAQLDEQLKQMEQAKSDEEDVSATIATNIEH
ncbi:MAG: alpha-N-acetylglucosaminidase C-terminal domain-containing protein [Clostridia bacterium]|nr:alpha-N-acetylglucosaminidase C-terminal domain-containing protein [Clostridia bacterium]